MSEPLDLEPIKAREKAATPGPWTNPWQSPEARSDGFYTDQPTDSPPNAIEPDAIVVVSPWDGGSLMVREHDAAFIANARQDVPALVQEVERLREFARNVSDNFDHDNDAHRYGTFCRRCQAEKVLGR